MTLVQWAVVTGVVVATVELLVAIHFVGVAQGLLKKAQEITAEAREQIADARKQLASGTG